MPRPPPVAMVATVVRASLLRRPVCSVVMVVPAVAAVALRVRPPEATAAPVVRVVPASPPSRRVSRARPAARVALVAPVATLWREPRAMAALLVPVVTVVPVPMVTLAIPLALPAVTVGMPERLALPGSARFRAPTVLVPMAATVARAVMASLP